MRSTFQLVVIVRLSFGFTSVEHSSRPSFIGTSTIRDDGSRGEGKKIELFVETCFS